MTVKSLAIASTTIFLIAGIVLSISQCQGCAAKKPIEPGSSPSPTVTPTATPTPTPAPTQRPVSKPAGKLVKLTHDKLKLEYAVYLPKDYKPERQWPLVVAFGQDVDRPLYDSAEGFAEGLEEIADAHGYLVLMPRTSKDYPEKAPTAETLKQCVAEASAQVDAAIARWSVDQHRMVVTGWCKSPAVATALAIDRPGRFVGLHLAPYYRMVTQHLDAAKLAKCKGLRVLISEHGGPEAKWFRDTGFKSVTVKGEMDFDNLPSLVPAK